MAVQRLNPFNPAPPTDEETLSVVGQNEAESFSRLPTLDIESYSKKTDWFKLTGQGFMDSIVQQALDTPATTFLLAGRREKEKRIEKYGDKPFVIAEVEGQKFMYDPTEDNPTIKVAEKIRNTSIAIRKWLALDEANRVKPEGFGEEMASGVGSAAGSMLGLILATMAGTAAGTAVSPGPGSVAGAIGGYSTGITMSAVNEKAIMAKQMIDAGYSTEVTERLSNLYGASIAVLDYGSLGVMGKLFRPALSRVVTGTVARRIAGIGLKAAEGAITEGGTEGLQNRIQTETEIALKLRDRDFQKDFTGDLLAFSVGSLIGGSVGTAGQLRHRKDTINRVMEKTGLSYEASAGFVDEAFLRANESVYDVLIDHYDISQDVAWIDRAFKKVEGKSELGPMPERVDETMPDEYQGYETLLEAVQTDEAAKALPKRIGKLREDIRTMEGVRQGLKDEDARIAQQKLDELGAELEDVKAKHADLLEKNPKLMALLSEGDALIEEHKTADPARKVELEQKIDDINFALQNPGSVQAAVKAAEAKVGSLEATAREQYEKLVELESGTNTNETIWLRTKAGKEVLVYKNPTQAQMNDLNRAFKEKWPKAPAGEPKTRSTRDDKGNTYAWMADDIHGEVEPALTAKYGGKFNQNMEARSQKESAKKLEGELTKTVEALLRAERQLGGMETIAERLKGNAALTSGQVRIAMRQQLRQILDAYTMGRRFSGQDLKSIQKAFKVLLKGSNLSRRSAMSMLRSVLTIRTPEQFNEKIGVIVGHINSLIRAEKVGEYQKIGWKMLEKMKTSEGKVTPEAQVLAEHLRRVFRGQVPQVHEGGEGNVNDLVNSQVEQAVYDLANSEDDAGAAKRSLEILRGYYTNKLQKFQDFKKAQKETYQRIAETLEKQVTKDVKFDDLKAAFDHTRQKDKRKNQYRMTPYETAIMSVLNELDNNSGAKNMEGPLVREFNSDRPYQKMVVLRGLARDHVEGRMLEIYGPRAFDLWLNTRTKDFLDVAFVPVEEGGAPRSVNISKAEAMSLYLMTKMPGIYNELLRMGVDEAWLNSFKNSDNVKFTKEDYAYMEAQREALDWMAEEIAPVYERLTGKPFRRVDNYFMTMRYMARSLEEGGIADTTGVIEEMLSGDIEALDPTDVDSLKRRTKSKALFAVPDLFEAMSFYMNDMVHFVAFADQAVKYQKVFQNERVKKIMAERMPKGFDAIFNDHIRMLVSGSLDRSSDRRSMGFAFKLLGIYSRNQVASPRNFLRQLTGVAIAMDEEGGGPVEMALAIADLSRAVKSGELKMITDTKYMKERFAGLYEMAVLYVQEQARGGSQYKHPLGNPWWTNKQLHDAFTSFPRYGDRFASVAVGWMIYRHRMSKTLTARDMQMIEEIQADQPKLSSDEARKVFAAQEAIRVIDRTQQSMDAGKLPTAFGRSDALARLATVFQRTTAVIYDRHMNVHKMYAAKRISTKQFIRSMLVYHVYMPILETLVTAGKLPPWETGLAMLTGPLSFHILIGQAIRSIIAGLLEGVSDDKAKLPFYLKDAANTTLVGSMTRDVLKLGRAVSTELRESLKNGPDFESAWEVIKAGAKVGDFAAPVPTGYIARALEGMVELFSGTPEEIINGAKKIAGWPESRTKSEED